MRTRQSLKNVIISMATYFITLATAFISRVFFTRLLGAEYLGINGLFGSVISLMSVVEFGFGTAVIFNLYRPLSEKNQEQVKSLLHFYKIIYRFVACIIVVIGIILIPFIPFIVGEVNIKDNIYFIFALFVADSASSYLLSYKRSIFYADQKNYVINIVHTIINVCMKAFQIIALYNWRNYIVFLNTQILLHLIENTIISMLANKDYPYLKESNIEQLDTRIKDDIIKKVKGLLFHQIGWSLLQGTDNIVMSMTNTLGVIAVGKYSNYIMITNNLNAIIGEIFSSVTASVGNLFVEKSTEEVYKVYKRILFANAALCNFVCTSIFVCIEPFIIAWLGKDYLLPASLGIIVSVNFYIQEMKRTCGMFKTAAGVFYEDRYVPIIEGVINIATSIAFAYLIGISGIVMGTIVSSMVHWMYDFPKYVYSMTFKKKIKQYIKDYVPYISVFVFSAIITRCVSDVEIMNKTSQIGNLILNMLVCTIIPNIIFVVFFYKKEELHYWYHFILGKFKRNDFTEEIATKH